VRVLYNSAPPTRQFARHLQRVVLVEPHAPTSRMMGDLLKDLGAARVRIATTAAAGLALVKEEDPQLIITEFSALPFDGLSFVRSLRRSDMDCRRAPVIMVTAEATAQAITGARDAGVHEFLRKPFTLKDLIRRIEAVTLKSRDWVEAVRYIGPDRRRFNSAEYQGPRKRLTDTAGSRTDQALRILKSAVAAIESDPKQALRSMQAQAEDLSQVAVGESDAKLARHAAGLQRRLHEAIAAGRLDRAKIEAAAAPLLAQLPADCEAEA
jgi:DNA-binding response OmpR family regulator